jgi:N-carbamoyl-L-amino-acid hydrolase
VTGERGGEAAFLEDFAYLSTIGGTARGGVNREAATIPDAMQRAWFGGWLSSRGFRVEVDEIGNQFGLMEFVPGAPYILTGSHLDSQPTAGRFDGAYGVAASASAGHAIAVKVAAGEIEPRFNIAIVNWFNEEGSRFPPSMMGSSVFTGKLALQAAYSVEDRGGVSVEQALTLIGMKGEAASLSLAGYVEIHIEQGRELEANRAQIGIVTGTWGARKFQVRFIGSQSHTGPTPMSERQDALLTAAETIVQTRALADQFAEAPLHTAVSTLEIYPNSPVVVASDVSINLDLRSPVPSVLDEAERLIIATAERIGSERGVGVRIERTHHWDDNQYTPELFDVVEEVCIAQGLSHRRLLTVAGHDSTNMKDVVPTIMLFVPSRDGVSHNELEFTEEADLLAGRRTMVGLLEKLVQETQWSTV